MIVHQTSLQIPTKTKGLFDITERVQAALAASGVQRGLCCVFVLHTSASLIIQENADPSVLRDLERFMARLVPESETWEHDDEGPDDMPAHVRGALTRTSEMIPVVEGRLALGTWQGVYLWEHRTRGRERTVLVHVQGVG
ncbi:MAG: secondary thiamine-phosphate synthase enzyme YjbQ [Polyangiaceae bacterium]|jgi:secondary thiamine-phosphate synthase enzyme|nr:secondary thiamine-phosphate synthase enzyme YjbQ [Polyangiaceae bacterium]